MLPIKTKVVVFTRPGARPTSLVCLLFQFPRDSIIDEIFDLEPGQFYIDFAHNTQRITQPFRGHTKSNHPLMRQHGKNVKQAVTGACTPLIVQLGAKGVTGAVAVVAIPSYFFSLRNLSKKSLSSISSMERRSTRSCGLTFSAGASIRATASYTSEIESLKEPGFPGSDCDGTRADCRPIDRSAPKKESSERKATKTIRPQTHKTFFGREINFISGVTHSYPASPEINVAASMYFLAVAKPR